MKRAAFVLFIAAVALLAIAPLWAAGKSPESKSLVCPTCKVPMTMSAGPHGAQESREHFCPGCGSKFEVSGSEVDHTCTNCKTQIQNCPECAAELKKS